MRPARTLGGPCLILLVAWVANACLAGDRTEGPSARWWKGNTHTHTLWSDGDAAPEQVVDWYRQHGYAFLVLSDHNVFSQGERWMPVEEGGRLTPQRVQALVERFGDDALDRRERDGVHELRLATLEELRACFEQPGAFLLVQGEEISDKFEQLPVHVNGLNLADCIPPQGGASVGEVLQRNVSAVAEQGRRLGRTTLAHVNHPNFGWALTWEDVAALREDRFFEVYNGHPAVRNAGDAEHPAIERLWDLALTRRLAELDLGLLYGVATDDAHNYHDSGPRFANAGRGWIVVRAPELTAEALLAAMRRGEFYASSGVTIRDFGPDDGDYRVEIEGEAGVSYSTRFIGTRWQDGRPSQPGIVLAESGDNPARYRFRGDELYVRAVVISDRPHPNPYTEGDLERAWLQPVLGPAGR